MTDGLVQLGSFGVIGVMLALVGLVGYVVYLLWKFACNHVKHSNEAFNENTKALKGLTDIIDFKLK